MKLRAGEGRERTREERGMHYRGMVSGENLNMHNREGSHIVAGSLSLF